MRRGSWSEQCLLSAGPCDHDQKRRCPVTRRPAERPGGRDAVGTVPRGGPTCGTRHGGLLRLVRRRPSSFNSRRPSVADGGPLQRLSTRAGPRSRIAAEPRSNLLRDRGQPSRWSCSSVGGAGVPGGRRPAGVTAKSASTATWALASSRGEHRIGPERRHHRGQRRGVRPPEHPAGQHQQPDVRAAVGIVRGCRRRASTAASAAIRRSSAAPPGSLGT